LGKEISQFLGSTIQTAVLTKCLLSKQGSSFYSEMEEEQVTKEVVEGEEEEDQDENEKEEEGNDEEEEEDEEQPARKRRRGELMRRRTRTTTRRRNGTLFITLPSVHTGGELTINIGDQTKVYSLGHSTKTKKGQYKCHFSAYSTEAKARFSPLESGFRVVLVYSLYPYMRFQRSPMLQKMKQVKNLATLLGAWTQKAPKNTKLVNFLEKPDTGLRTLSYHRHCELSHYDATRIQNLLAANRLLPPDYRIHIYVADAIQTVTYESYDDSSSIHWTPKKREETVSLLYDMDMTGKKFRGMCDVDFQSDLLSPVEDEEELIELFKEGTRGEIDPEWDPYEDQQAEYTRKVLVCWPVQYSLAALAEPRSHSPHHRSNNAHRVFQTIF
jgi:hypothetical protein